MTLYCKHKKKEMAIFIAQILLLDSSLKKDHWFVQDLLTLSGKSLESSYDKARKIRAQLNKREKEGLYLHYCNKGILNGY